MTFSLAGCGALRLASSVTILLFAPLSPRARAAKDPPPSLPAAERKAAPAQVTAPAGEVADEERQALRAAVEALRRDHEKQIQDLRTRLEAAERAAAAQRFRGRADDEDDRRNSPTLSRRDLALTLSGFIHADLLGRTPSPPPDVNPSTGQPTNELRFLIRRARIRADVRWGILSGGVELDGNTVSGATARLQSAEVALRWSSRERDAVPYIMVTGGLFKVPFGFEVRLQSDKERVFLERSNIMRAFFPGEYDLGVKVQGGYKWLRYNFGLMNGAPAGDKQFSLRDPTQSKDFVGRLGFDPPRFGPLTFVIGLSGLYGEGLHAGAAASDGTLVWKDANDNGAVDAEELSAVGAHPASPSQTFPRWALGGDVRMQLQLPRLGTLMAYAEVVAASNLDRGLLVADPIAAGRDLSEIGYYIAVTQEVTRWALVGARFDEYLVDRDAPEVSSPASSATALRFSTLSLLAQARYGRYGRLFFEYDYNRTTVREQATGTTSDRVDHLLGARAELVF